MKQYIIQHNDNLWNIAKKEYGKKLKSDADIQKTVDKIVKANNIENPNLIYADEQIKLPGLKKEDIFSKYEKWQTKHAINMKNAANNIYDMETYEKLEDEIGKTFNFMEEKDPDSKKDYNAQTLKLAQGEIARKDSNEDNLLSFSEYFSGELAQGVIDDYKEAIESDKTTKEEAIDELSDTYIKAQSLFIIIDEKMGNNDKYIDEKEMQTYLQYQDTYSQAKDPKKGSFHIEDITGYVDYLTSQVDIEVQDEQRSSVQKLMQKLLEN